MPHPFDQHRYQVRFDWGLDGLLRLAPADVVVVVDVLPFATEVTDAATRAASTGTAAHPEAAAIAEAAATAGSLVLLGGLRNASAVAHAMLAEQHAHTARTSVAIVAVGDRDPGASVRFAVEDQLGAGAIVDALGALGIDHTSPEAAVAAEAFRGLRGALRHLLTASASGQDLIDRGRREDAIAAAELDATSIVPVLRDGIFVAHRP